MSNEMKTQAVEDQELTIRVKNFNIELRIPAWRGLPKVTTADDCVFLVREIETDGIDPLEESVERFTELLRRVLGTGHVTGKLSPVVMIPLVGSRMALAAYMRSDRTREELNALLGEEVLLLEGEIGPAL